MSQLTDQMNAAIANLKAANSGLTAGQVNDIITQAISPLQATIDQITASEKSDEDKLNDVTAAVTEFTAAFAGSSSAPAPSPAPAPEPSPAPAPAAV